MMEPAQNCTGYAGQNQAFGNFRGETRSQCLHTPSAIPEAAQSQISFKVGSDNRGMQL